VAKSERRLTTLTNRAKRADDLALLQRRPAYAAQEKHFLLAIRVGIFSLIRWTSMRLSVGRSQILTGRARSTPESSVSSQNDFSVSLLGFSPIQPLCWRLLLSPFAPVPNRGLGRTRLQRETPIPTRHEASCQHSCNQLHSGPSATISCDSVTGLVHISAVL
jgi:hypothetical protein